MLGASCRRGCTAGNGFVAAGLPADVLAGGGFCALLSLPATAHNHHGQVVHASNVLGNVAPVFARIPSVPRVVLCGTIQSIFV